MKTIKFNKISDFDPPVNYSRIGYNNGELGFYRKHRPNVEQKNGYIRMHAVPDNSMGILRGGTYYRCARLVTKDTFTFKAPAWITVKGRWNQTSKAFMCLLWLFPLNPNRVMEVDVVEWEAGNPHRLMFTLWWTGEGRNPEDVGEKPYESNLLKKSQKISSAGDTEEFRKYHVLLLKKRIIWFKGILPVKIRRVNATEDEFYLRSTIQTASWAENDALSPIASDNPATMDLAFIKVRLLGKNR